MNPERFCLDCGEKLHGRIDKKFCGDQCRSNYNNKLYNENHTVIRLVNSRLKRNRRILEELNPGGKIKVSIKKLQQKGFDFSHITGLYHTQTGKTYYFCYEYGYLPIENDEYLLVRREENL